jgi:hypothetical protein
VSRKINYSQPALFQANRQTLVFKVSASKSTVYSGMMPGNGGAKSLASVLSKP